MTEKILMRLDSIDEKMTSVKKGVDGLTAEIYVGRDGRDPVTTRLKSIETKIEANGQRTMRPPPNRKVELALIGVLMAVIAAAVKVLG